MIMAAQRLALCTAILAGLCAGCGRTPPPDAITLYSINHITELPTADQKDSDVRPITFEIAFYKLPEARIGQRVLSNLFTHSLDCRALTQPRIRQSQLWQTSQSFTNIELRLSPSRLFATRLNAEFLPTLVKSITNSGAESFPPQRATAFRERDVLISRTDSQTVVLGGAPASNSPVIATPLDFGQTTHLRFIPEKSGAIVVDFDTQTASFAGYQEKSTPSPILALSVMAMRTRLLTNEAMVLASQPLTNVISVTHKIPLLSLLPYFGSTFIRQQLVTNVFRTLVSLTPVAPPSDQTDPPRQP